ncbi:MAG: hypothetical protein ACO38D_01335 [Ilumatobacteraceae bacterium]
MIDMRDEGDVAQACACGHDVSGRVGRFVARVIVQIIVIVVEHHSVFFGQGGIFVVL